MDEAIKFLVSVSCMTYNQASYIEDAMDGFCMQQTTFPFLCLIADDASIDGEPEVIRKYLDSNFDKIENGLSTEDETDEYLRIYARHKENKNCYFCVFLLKYNHYSIGKAKTTSAAELTKSVKYVAMCEGDDYWTDPMKLQKQVEFLEGNAEYDMCCTRFVHYYEETLNFDDRDLYSGLIGNDMDGMELKHEHFISAAIPHPCTLMYRNGTLDDNDLIKKLKYKYDIPKLWCFMRSHRAWLINEKTAVYRKHKGTLTARNVLSRSTTFYETYKDIYKYDKNPIIKNLYFRWFKSYVVQYIKYSNQYSIFHVIGVCFEFIGFRPSWVECKAFGVNFINAHKYRIKTGKNERMECERF